MVNVPASSEDPRYTHPTSIARATVLHHAVFTEDRTAVVARLTGASPMLAAGAEVLAATLAVVHALVI